jgi:hypothetical protein
MRRISHPGCFARESERVGRAEADRPGLPAEIHCKCLADTCLAFWTNPLNSGRMSVLWANSNLVLQVWDSFRACRFYFSDVDHFSRDVNRGNGQNARSEKKGRGLYEAQIARFYAG